MVVDGEKQTIPRNRDERKIGFAYSEVDKNIISKGGG